VGEEERWSIALLTRLAKDSTSSTRVRLLRRSDSFALEHIKQKQTIRNVKINRGRKGARRDIESFILVDEVLGMD